MSTSLVSVVAIVAGVTACPADALKMANAKFVYNTAGTITHGGTKTSLLPNNQSHMTETQRKLLVWDRLFPKGAEQLGWMVSLLSKKDDHDPARVMIDSARVHRVRSLAEKYLAGKCEVELSENEKKNEKKKALFRFFGGKNKQEKRINARPDLGPCLKDKEVGTSQTEAGVQATDATPVHSPVEPVAEASAMTSEEMIAKVKAELKEETRQSMRPYKIAAAGGGVAGVTGGGLALAKFVSWPSVSVPAVSAPTVNTAAAATAGGVFLAAALPTWMGYTIYKGHQALKRAPCKSLQEEISEAATAIEVDWKKIMVEHFLKETNKDATRDGRLFKTSTGEEVKIGLGGMFSDAKVQWTNPATQEQYQDWQTRSTKTFWNAKVNGDKGN
jgi:hypothetical protein